MKLGWNQWHHTRLLQKELGQFDGPCCGVPICAYMTSANGWRRRRRELASVLAEAR